MAAFQSYHPSLLLKQMNIDVSNPKYTLEEIAAQCKHAINNGRLRGKVSPARTVEYKNKYWCE